MPGIVVGSRVWVRGRYSTRFSIHGKVETIETTKLGWMEEDPPLYGTRLENGNFMWCPAERLRLESQGGQHAVS